MEIPSDFKPQCFQESSEILSATSNWKLQNVHEVLAGEGVVIAILDTGIDTSHEAFKEKQNSIKGYNFVDDKKDTFSKPELHGNMVAFVAAGKGFTARHKKGGGEITPRPIPSGVAPNAKLIVCRVGNPYKWEYVIEALEKLIIIKKARKEEQKKPKEEQNSKRWGVDIVSMSFGETHDVLTGDVRDKIQELIEELSFLGVILVAAAGNYGNIKPTLFPANHPNVFSVGALNEHNKPAEMNPTGGVDVYAPGVNIATPLVHNVIRDGVEISNGTSCAAPAIAGLVALKIQFERNKHELLNNVSNDKYVQQILREKPKLRFLDMKMMFKDMQRDVDRPDVLDPYNYFKKECRLNIE